MEMPVGLAGKASVWQALIYSPELWEEVWAGDVEFGSPWHRDGETMGGTKPLGVMWNKIWREQRAKG